MKNKLTILFILITANTIFSQADKLIPQIFQGNPEISQIQKYKETPVSLNTGVPNISVPLYQINVDGVSIPIELNYHSTGFKVNEIATSVGLGWSLSCNSAVNRIVRGRPDESLYGYIFTDKKAATISQYQIADFIHADKKVDLEPDVFNVNLPNGKSIEFMFKQDQADNRHNVICFPLSDVKIVPNVGVGNIGGFVITDNDGTKYFYGGDAIDTSRSKTFSYDVEEQSLPAEDVLAGTDYVTSAWHLTSIQTTKGNIITYNYREESYSVYKNCEHSNQTISFDYVPRHYLDKITSFSLSGRMGTNKILTNIVTPKEKIEFIAGSFREDLDFNKKIVGIKILDKYNTQVNEIEFKQSYFYNPNTELYMGFGCGQQFDKEMLSKRLKLDEVEFKGKMNANPDDYYRYKFEYNTSVLLPHRNSFAQDYWGYYNGADDNVDMIPSVFLNTKKTIYGQEDEEEAFTLKVANNNSIRYVNPAFTQANMLQKIIYPEGGYTLLEYENNTISAEDNTDKYIIDSNSREQISLDTRLEPNLRETQTVFFAGAHYYVFKKDFVLDERFVNEYGLHFVSSSSTCDPIDDQTGDMNIDCDRYNIKKISANEFIYDPLLNHSVGAEEGYFRDGYYTPGTYQLQVYVNKDEWDHATGLKPQIIVTVDWLKRLLGDERYFGGLRIKSIKNFNYDNSLLTEKRYDYDGPDNISSGKFLNFPILKEVKPATYKHYSNIICTDHQPNVFFSGLEGGYRISFSANSYAPLLNKGNFIQYEHVKEITYNYNNGNTIRSESKFSFYPPVFNYMAEPVSELWQNGKLLEKTSPNTSEINTYDSSTSDHTVGYDVNARNFFCVQDTSIPECQSPSLPRYIFFGDWREGNESRYYLFTNNYFNDVNTVVTDNVAKVTKNFYDDINHLQLTRQETTSSAGDTEETKYYYAQDTELDSEPYIDEMRQRNMVGMPIKTETYSHGEKLSEKKTEYGLFPTHSTYITNLLPKFIYTAKGNDALESRITFEDYDNWGNLISYNITSGTPVTIIWGYQHTQPIAKVEGATKAQVEAALGMSLSLVTESNRNQINNLRSGLPHAMITTYAYAPLIGISTVIDPKGYTTYYLYDDFGRLSAIKDGQGKILSDNQYHYKKPN